MPLWKIIRFLQRRGKLFFGGKILILLNARKLVATNTVNNIYTDSFEVKAENGGMGSFAKSDISEGSYIGAENANSKIYYTHYNLRLWCWRFEFNACNWLWLCGSAEPYGKLIIHQLLQQIFFSELKYFAFCFSSSSLALVAGEIWVFCRHKRITLCRTRLR